MSIKRFTPEFKEEAVRQVVDRGYKAPRRINGRPSIISPNRVNQDFHVNIPDHTWVTDITYIRT